MSTTTMQTSPGSAMTQRTEILTAAHLGVLGKTGSGKTYASKSLVEELIRARRRVCIIDPTGAWWGLKASADGKRAGLPVVVLGGEDEYRDLPLTEHTAAAIAGLVGTGGMDVSVLDLSGLSISGQHRFVERFLEELYRVNRGVLHLVIDEADEFAPQSGAPGTERVLGATARVVQRGRKKGFRAILISQRPAVLNKRVLTQCNALIAMRLPAPQDRKAIEDWVKGQADVEQAAELLGSLSKLTRGEGWIWAPEQDALYRVKFGEISTFDSGRTPDGSETHATPKAFAELDLSGLKSALEESIKEAEANDPKKLQAKINELEEQLAEKGVAAPAAPAVDVEEIRQQAYTDGEVAAVGRAREAWLPIFEKFELLSGGMANVLELARVAVQFGVDWNTTQSGARVGAAEVCSGRDREDSRPGESPGSEQPKARTPAPTHTARPARESARAGGGHHDNGHPAGVDVPRSRDLGVKHPQGPLQKILDACAWWYVAGVKTPTRVQVAIVAGYTAGGGSFRRYLSDLSSKKLIEYAGDGMYLTHAGLRQANRHSDAPSLAELHARMRNILDGPCRKLIDVALKARGGEVTRTQLAELCGYEAAGGSFRRYLSTLSSLGLIRYPKKTTVAAAAILFPEGLR